jgi:anti-sigma factor RsiW
MPMRSCREVMAGIDAVVDGEVGRGAQLRFSLHLAMCADCERYVRQYLSARDALGSVDPAALPDDFAAVLGRVLAAIGVDARN